MTLSFQPGTMCSLLLPLPFSIQPVLASNRAAQISAYKIAIPCLWAAASVQCVLGLEQCIASLGKDTLFNNYCDTFPYSLIQLVSALYQLNLTTSLSMSTLRLCTLDKLLQMSKAATIGRWSEQGILSITWTLDTLLCISKLHTLWSSHEVVQWTSLTYVCV